MKVTVGADIENITFNEQDSVAAVMQNISMILSTRQGDVPLYPEFGLPRKFEGKPDAVAIQLMIAEIQDAVEVFEPRARILNINVEVDPEQPGRFVPKVEVDIK